MNTKLITIFSVLIALAVVSAQVPAITSLTSKIESVSASYTQPEKTSIISSASSAISRISSAVNADRSSITSALSSATSAQQSASSVASSLASVAATQNAGAITFTRDFPGDFGIQFLALVALFVASFAVMLA